MEQHAVPRQITTFEFKLIGFLTVKQFIYLLFFGAVAALTYFAVPVKYVNVLLAAVVMGVGGIFALYRYNERELDVWIKNVVVSLLSPSQYYYMKRNVAPDFLKDIMVFADDAMALTHIDANQKLNKYMQSKNGLVTGDPKKQEINVMLQQQAVPTPTAAPVVTDGPISQAVDAAVQTDVPQVQTAVAAHQTPGVVSFLSGVVHNNKKEPLPNIMVYINSEAQQVVRILKTNHHGLFATFHPLPEGSYSISPKDLGGKYFFDTMEIAVNNSPIPPIEMYSKEVL